jgi:hypothetical protein
MAKNSFVIYYDLEEQTVDFTDAQLGQLLRAIFALEKRGDSPAISDPVVRTAYKFLSTQLSLNKDRYEARCEVNAKNGAKGGRPKNEANEFAYYQVNILGVPPSEVYPQWVKKRGSAISLLVDPKDSFRKAIRKKRK